jgi:CRISPR/Cas system CMR subunit Cmr4 (Cas7 group RAMP superfamily)
MIEEIEEAEEETEEEEETGEEVVEDQEDSEEDQPPKYLYNLTDSQEFSLPVDSRTPSLLKI